MAVERIPEIEGSAAERDKRCVIENFHFYQSLTISSSHALRSGRIRLEFSRIVVKGTTLKAHEQ